MNGKIKGKSRFLGLYCDWLLPAARIWPEKRGGGYIFWVIAAQNYIYPHRNFWTCIIKDEASRKTDVLHGVNNRITGDKSYLIQICFIHQMHLKRAIPEFHTYLEYLSWFFMRLNGHDWPCPWPFQVIGNKKVAILFHWNGENLKGPHARVNVFPTTKYNRNGFLNTTFVILAAVT